MANTLEAFLGEVAGIDLLVMSRHHGLRLVFFQRCAIPGLFFFIYIFSIVPLVDKILLMTGFEPRISVSEGTALPTEPQPLKI